MSDVEDFTRSLLTMITSPTAEQRIAIESNTQPAREVLGKCLVCEKDVFENQKAYSCADRECKFVLWKEIAGKAISPTIAKGFFAGGGRSPKVSGFKSKAGKPFEALLVWSKEENKVVFEFVNDSTKKRK